MSDISLRKRNLTKLREYCDTDSKIDEKRRDIHDRRKDWLSQQRRVLFDGGRPNGKGGADELGGNHADE